MAFQHAALMALALAGAATAVEVRVNGGTTIPLYDMPADTALDNKASWGGGHGNLASLPSGLDKPDVSYWEVPELYPGEALEIEADAAPQTGGGSVPAPTECTSTAFVAVYACGDSACEGKVRGDFAAQLEGEGWQKITYGARFTLLSSGTLQHTTHLYAKTIDAGETVATPPVAQKTSFLGVFTTGCGVASGSDTPAPGTGAGAGGPAPAPQDASSSDPAPSRNVGPTKTQCATQCPADAGTGESGSGGDYSYSNYYYGYYDYSR